MIGKCFPCRFFKTKTVIHIRKFKKPGSLINVLFSTVVQSWSFSFTPWSTYLNQPDLFFWCIISTGYFTWKSSHLSNTQERISSFWICFLNLSLFISPQVTVSKYILVIIILDKLLTVTSNNRFYFSFIYSFSNGLSCFIRSEFLTCTIFLLCRTYVIISYRASLLVTNSLNFCLSDDIFISPSCLKGNFNAYGILYSLIFSFNTLYSSLLLILACMVSVSTLM